MTGDSVRPKPHSNRRSFKRVLWHTRFAKRVRKEWRGWTWWTSWGPSLMLIDHLLDFRRGVR